MSSSATIAAPVVSLGEALNGIGSAGRIVFYRTQEAWPPVGSMIDPDGTNELAVAERGVLPGLLSPDGTRLAIREWVGDWVRPALINVDGSGMRLLDAYPGQHLNLVPLGWSSDGSRLFVYDGFDTPKTVDMGTFTVRASDGGGIESVLPAGSDVFERPDFVHVSPNGQELLVSRQEKASDPNVFILKSDGSGLIRVNPSGTAAVEIPVGDFLERGGLSEDWSPDGSRITFGAHVDAVDSTALYVADADGSHVRQIVSTDVGAVSAQWSPDGAWIAFTSLWRRQPQVWVVHPDGSGLRQLTTAEGDSTSVAPVWSPDGKHLLFERKESGKTTLWTMNVDGSAQTQLTRTPLGNDYTGPYQWLSAGGR